MRRAGPRVSFRSVLVGAGNECSCGRWAVQPVSAERGAGWLFVALPTWEVSVLLLSLPARAPLAQCRLKAGETPALAAFVGLLLL